MLVETFLPVFSGFYCTNFSCDCEELFIEDGLSYDDYNWNYAPYHKAVAKKSCEFIQKKLGELGIDCKITFQSIYSPREYNFTNDSINISISFKLKEVRAQLNQRLNSFGEYLKDRYTKCDGFAPKHSNNVEDWLNEMTNEHKLGAILDFLLNDEFEELEFEMASFTTEDSYPDYELKEEVTV